ncbi:capsule assembly Wzi family protein [Spirosoma endbachense]|uniref:Capsule assembly Wzi family protein n=1 Tax=Spirosoma endbachense TaxID=2666025 RepID=A0A6P1VWT6_9BACT|nr:capsule assembly Wzi family protein [Spirosoma endbachense]QHV97215.1 hypothetical protein GJR95_20365 [Spirosoma endbachense]
MHGFYGWSVLLVGVLISHTLRAQRSLLSGHADVSMYGANASQTPFWLRTNQWGVVPPNTPAVSLQLGICRSYKQTDSLRKPLVDWGFGVKTVGNLLQNALSANSRQVLLPEAYVKVRLGRFELWGGRRQQIIGLVDTVLSSGSYSVSGNALPIPQIQFVLPDFLPLPFLGNAVAVKGSFTHGWFNAPYIRGVNLHQKAIFLKLGRPSSRLHGIVGLNHEVQWGGYADYLKNSPFAVDGHLTTNFGDYLKSVVLGIIPKDLGNIRYTSFDAANRIGNHLGSIDIGLSLILPASSWFIYHQHPYEDASGLSWRNAPDGLYGLRWLNRQTKSAGNRFWTWHRVLGEVLLTRDQSGPYFSAPGQTYKGADNYYNHSQYVEGWSYFGQTIGTPFLIPRPMLSSTSEPGEFYFPSNRVIAYYAAFEASIKNRISMTGRFSYSQNFGTYSTPFRSVENQFSGMLSASIPLPLLHNSVLSVALAADQGQLLAKSMGLRVGLRRQW